MQPLLRFDLQGFINLLNFYGFEEGVEFLLLVCQEFSQRLELDVGAVLAHIDGGKNF